MEHERTRQLIEDNAHVMETCIREYSRAQQKYWREIPYAALEADARPTSDDNLILAYTHGYLRLRTKGFEEIFVHLLTGELVQPRFPSWNLTGHYPELYQATVYAPASREAVLSLATQPGCLDAKLILEQLQLRATFKESPSVLTDDEINQCKARISETLGIELRCVEVPH